MDGMSVTLSTTGKVLVSFSATILHDSNNHFSEIILLLDGSTELYRTRTGMQSANETRLLSFTWYSVTAPSAGSHTYAIHWRSGSTLNNVSSQGAAPPTGLGTPRVLSVVELGQ